jgi:O-antigen chain-terminating methyltransferase
MNNNFYRAFEDLHRGQRNDIIRRLQVYLPFVFPVAKGHPHAQCLDLGCGRGEWLQLLKEHGIQAHGVDLDADMLAAAQALSLSVRQADAIQALEAIPDGCIAVLSAFHLVEHLPFESLQKLVTQAHRVLVPGGLLIMETPNPDNMQVATSNFYLDPSHIKPIPSKLLSFVTEHTGFARTKVLGLQESPGLRYQPQVQLQDVLAGASPDYAVIAQKTGVLTGGEQLKSAFERDYGLSTADLAQTYAHQQLGTVKRLEMEIHARQIEINDLREKIQQDVRDLRQLQSHSDQQIFTLQIRTDQLAAQIQAIEKSALFRLGRPLQWVLDQYVKLRQHGLKTRLEAFARKVGWGKANSDGSDQAPH